jgi:hypothetical protein
MHPLMVRASLGLSIAAVALACEGNNSLPAGPSGPAPTSDQVLATNATIRYVGIEGGCWGLVTPQGQYEPVSLASQFRVDGLAVYAVVRSAPTAVSACMMAPLVTVESIRTR